MKSNVFRALAAVAAAFALSVPMPGFAAPTTSDEVLGVRPTPRADRDGGCGARSTSPVASTADDERAVERVVGKIVALDAPNGVAMLATAGGVLALKADADTLSRLDVGDVVVVELVDGDGDGAASGKTECI